MRTVLLTIFGLLVIVGMAYAADQQAGSEVRVFTPVGGKDSAGDARALKVETDGSVITSTKTTSVCASDPGAAMTVTTVFAADANHLKTFTAGACIRIWCDAFVRYSTGTSTVTASASSIPLPGNSIEKICLESTDDSIAFITATGTASCQPCALASP